MQRLVRRLPILRRRLRALLVEGLVVVVLVLWVFRREESILEPEQIALLSHHVEAEKVSFASYRLWWVLVGSHRLLCVSLGLVLPWEGGGRLFRRGGGIGRRRTCWERFVGDVLLEMEVSIDVEAPMRCDGQGKLNP